MLQKSVYNFVMNESKVQEEQVFNFFMWIFMAVGECSVLVSCPVDISQVARGATWRHRDARNGGYRPLCTLIQHRPKLLCDDSWRASVWLEPLMPPHSWRRVSLGAQLLNASPVSNHLRSQCCLVDDHWSYLFILVINKTAQQSHTFS